ncbi:hypothetical protein F2Q69_00030012 [Brassica cretica]|uniref:Agenet domain-containing protein n=1 Tax=Brassica cretica TaxID=69181 RepID=A0A8S9S804_BRACR|nr:hypothetical protein F2Q69_00030012 [Brassica cretica]
MLKVEYSTRFRDKEKKTKKLQESVSIHSIRPQPPPGDTKGFELMDKVEAYHNDGWCSGEVHIILSNDIYSVRFNSSTEFIKFNLSDLRIPKEWVDGVWKMGKEGKHVVGMKRKVVGMKRKATAQPVDHLAFLQREEKRPIVPRNPPMPVRPEHVDVAFAMLNQKRIKQSSWFSEQGIPKACFNEETRVQTHFDVGANVEIASKDEDKYVKWYPGIVLKTYIRTGVEMLKVEYSTRFRDKEKMTKKLQKNVSIDSIHPQPPPGDTKGFELMEKVEAYHNDDCSTKFIQFNRSDMCIPKEWVDGVWKMEKEIEVQQTQSVKPRQDDHAKKGKHVVGMKRKATAQPVDRVKEEKPDVGMKRKSTAQPVDRVKEEKLVVGMKRKAIAQLVDRLAFLQREEKRPIVTRNPPMHVTPEHVDAAFAMLNQKKIKQSSWFSEQGIRKAWFVPVQFLETVGYSYENLQKPDKKGIKILKGWVDEVTCGSLHWGGDISDGEHNHNLSLCRSKGYRKPSNPKTGRIVALLFKRPVLVSLCENKVIIGKMLIPAIKLEMMNEEIKFNDIIPFQVNKAEGLPKTKLPFNCGLFVVKMLECRSLGLKKISIQMMKLRWIYEANYVVRYSISLWIKISRNVAEGDHSVSRSVLVFLCESSGGANEEPRGSTDPCQF